MNSNKFTGLANGSSAQDSATYIQLGQTAYTQTGAVATGSTSIPYDDSIPQNTEGDEYMTRSITPKSATSTLVIRVTAIVSTSANPQMMTLALFQDSTANALAATSQILNGSNTGQTTVLTLCHAMTSGTTSATTFKVRIGGNNPGTTTFNGAAGARLFGGVAASSIVIREFLT